MRNWSSSSRTSTPPVTLTSPDRADALRRPGHGRGIPAIKDQLGDPLAARLTGTVWCVTFVTVGELWQWATTRSWGPRTREQLEQWLGRVVILNSDDATSRAWGQDLGGGPAAGTPAASQR